MSKKIILSNKRDIPMLRFIWDWKIATFKTLALKFYPGLSYGTAYNRINELRNGKFIELKRDERGQRPVYTLTKKGFNAIGSEYLPLLRESGYKSEAIKHDLICCAVQLGEFLTRMPSAVSIITEQHLRRCELEVLPKWLPSPEIHRPDGYWKIGTPVLKKVIALEVQLNSIKNSQLAILADFYNENQNIDEVLWVVQNISAARSMDKKFEQLSNTQVNKHSFVLLNEFLDLGWQTKIVLGKNTNLILRQYIYEQNENNTITEGFTVLPLFILDTQISSRILRKKVISNQC